MEGSLILADTSVLIDHFRKQDKSRSALFALLEKNYRFSISSITSYEIYVGVYSDQMEYWNSLLDKIIVFPFTDQTAKTAATIDKELKKKRKQIAIPDLFIAATAIEHELPVYTLNKKHFERIDRLNLLD